MGFFANVFVVFFNPAYYETTKNATRTLKKKKNRRGRLKFKEECTPRREKILTYYTMS